MNTQEVLIELRRTGRGYAVTASSPTGRQAHHLCSEMSLREIVDTVDKWHTEICHVIELGWAELSKTTTLPDIVRDALSDMEGRLRGEGWCNVVELGQKLREVVFPQRSEVWELFREAWGEAEKQGQRMRLRFSSDVEELTRIPWEYLYIEELDTFLAADGSVSVLRFVSPDEQHLTVLPRANQLRVLLAASSPRVDPQHQIRWLPLNAGDELQRLRVALQGLESRNVMSLKILEPSGTKASKENLYRVLQEQDFHIVHYIGHAFCNHPDPSRRFAPDLGSGTWLVLEDAKGRAEYLCIEELASWLKRKSVRLVVLNACRTASFRVAQTLAQQSSVVAVVAMQFEMPDDSAPHFAEVFYRTLASQFPVDACVSAGRALLRGRFSRYRPDWGIPTVFTASTGDLEVYEPGDEILDAIAPQLTELRGSHAENTFGDGAALKLETVEGSKYLKLDFSFADEKGFAGWMIQLDAQRFDATPYSAVRFRVAGTNGAERVELAFRGGREERKVREIKNLWPDMQEIVIPLASVDIDWTRLHVITVASNATLLAQCKTTIYIGEIRFV